MCGQLRECRSLRDRELDAVLIDHGGSLMATPAARGVRRLSHKRPCASKKSNYRLWAPGTQSKSSTSIVTLLESVTLLPHYVTSN